MLVVFHRGHLPLRFSSIYFIFNWCRLPLRFSSIEVFFHLGCLQFSSSSIDVVSHWGHLSLRLSLIDFVSHWVCLSLRLSSIDCFWVGMVFQSFISIVGTFQQSWNWDWAWQKKHPIVLPFLLILAHLIFSIVIKKKFVVSPFYKEGTRKSNV